MAKKKKLHLKGRGIVRHREFPVRDLGDGGFRTPDPNIHVRDANLGLHRGILTSDEDEEERMRVRNESARELYQEGLRRLNEGLRGLNRSCLKRGTKGSAAVGKALLIVVGIGVASIFLLPALWNLALKYWPKIHTFLPP